MDDTVFTVFFHIGSFAFFMISMAVVCLIISISQMNGED